MSIPGTSVVRRVYDQILEMDSRVYHLLFLGCILIFLVLYVLDLQDLGRRTRQTPNIILYPTLLLVVSMIMIIFHSKIRGIDELNDEEDSVLDELDIDYEETIEEPQSIAEIRKNTLNITGWLGFFLIIIYLLGFVIAIPIFLVAYYLVHTNIRLRNTVIIVAAFSALLYVVFEVILNARLYGGIF